MDNYQKDQDIGTPNAVSSDETPAGGYPYACTAAPTPAPARIYKKHETVFAWLAFVIGYIFCTVIPPADAPLGATLFIAVLYASGVVFMVMSHVTITPRSVFWLTAGILPAAGLFLSSDTFTGTLAFVWSLGCFILWVDLAAGGGLEEHARELFFFDTIKAFLVMPFASLGAVFSASVGRGAHRAGDSSDGTATSGGRTFIYILLGIGLAIIPTVVVIGLLLYDNSFSDHLNAVIDFFGGDILNVIQRLIFAIPLAAYGFGALISAVDKKGERMMCADSCRRFAAGIRFAPVAMVCAAIIPLLAVYLLFFVSQWDYYLAAFGGRLPTGVDIYAFYARDGFFELCGVCAINAAVMAVANIFTKRRLPDRQSPAVRVVFATLSVSTIILIATAFSKLALYIDQYGLTRLRIYAAWFIAVLFAAFLIMLIKQIRPRTNATLCMIVAFALLFTCLTLVNIDGLIAGYNVSGYLDGRLTQLDTGVIANCGDSATPWIIRLRDELDTGTDINASIRRWALDQLSRREQSLPDATRSIFEMTLPRILADRALRVGAGG